MKTKLFAASCLVAASAHAQDATLHVTGAPGVLVQKTPSGWVGLCNTPCDVRGDRNAVYRFVGPAGGDIQESKSFILPPGDQVDLAVSAGYRSQNRIGILVAVIGGVVIATGIGFIIGGYVINVQNPGTKEGDPYQIGGIFGVIGGIVTTGLGAVHALSHASSSITAIPSNAPALPAPRALGTQLVSFDF